MSLSVIGIYKITSPSGRVYIGQSWDIKRRWRYHKNDRRGNGLLQRSIRKYGFDAHTFHILATFPPLVTQDVLNQSEQFFIRDYKERGVSLLNLTEGGYNAKLTDAHKDKIRKALTGYVRTEEHRRRLSESKKGIPRTEEWKQRVSRTLKGRPATWLKGKRLSAAHVEKIRVASTGRKHTEEFKERLAARNRRNQHLLNSPEAIAKRAAKLRGRKLSPEHCERMRLGQLRRWENWRAARV